MVTNPRPSVLRPLPLALARQDFRHARTTSPQRRPHRPHRIIFHPLCSHRGRHRVEWYLAEQPFRRRKPASTEATTAKRPSRIYSGPGALGATALVVGIVWFGAALSAPAPTDFSSNIVPSTGVSKNADPPISLLWFGDSVWWTIGGEIVEFSWPTGYNSPFDPRRVVIWVKGIFECPIMQEQTQSFGILRSGGGSCVGWEAKWSEASVSFSPDAFVWSGAVRDTYDGDGT